ncbi:MAG TPA: biopolymer transporter ExbD [Candidatus Dormibacteraeota bacterium]|nr:biopolymer transporter ExbD [Candidatus Dormibacteraeota bacterium]
MRPEQWRPSAVLRKRKTDFFTMIELSGLASLMIFFLALFMAPIFGYPDLPKHGGVDLAPTHHPKAMPGALKEDALRVMVTRDGSVYLNDSRVKNGDLASLLLQGLEEGSARKVYLQADARAKYGDVKSVLDLIQQAGIENVALMTEQVRQKPSP